MVSSEKNQFFHCVSTLYRMKWDKGVNWNNEKFIYSCKIYFYLQTIYYLRIIILINFNFFSCDITMLLYNYLFLTDTSL